MLVRDDIELGTDRALDEQGNYPGQAAAELEAFQNSLEGRLIEFTTDELYQEINDRTLRLCADLKARTDHLASLCGVVLPEDSVF